MSDPSTPIIRITSRAHFSAAHRLHAEGRDEAWNRKTFGWVMDFKDLKQIVSERIVKTCDCRNLNTDVPFLSGVIPTAENLAVSFWNELDGKIPGARLVRIALHETERNKAIYTGPPR